MKLTIHQRGTLIDLAKCKIALHVLGVENVSGRPVVWIKDAKRQFPMAIHADGHGSPPEFTVRLMTDEEQLALEERDADILLSLPFVAEITPELLEEKWHRR